jgi:hypothetical protein
LFIFAFLGIKISRNRQCFRIPIAIYAILIFFIGFIPLTVLSSPFIALKNSSLDDLSLLCLYNPNYIKKNAKYGYFESFIIESAQNFDFFS